MSSFAKSRTSKNGRRNRPSRQVKTQDAEPVVQVCWRGLVDPAIALLLSSNGRPTVGGEYEVIVVGESAVSISYCQSRTALVS